MKNISSKTKAKAVLSLVVISGITLFSTISTINNTINKINPSSDKIEQASSVKNKSSVSNMPTDEQLLMIKTTVKSQFKSMTYNNYGAYIINNNKTNLTAKNNARPYASNQVDKQNRPTTADAILTKQTRQYKTRQQTNNGATDWTPLGWHQLSNLPGTYKYAYNRGHLLGYALVGNIKGYDASESNKKNIITQTSWANQANSPTNTGQNYYEGLVRKALDQNKKVRYQVKAIYSNSKYNVVPYGTQIQAKSTDGTLEFNVFIPNVQGNININYDSGKANPNYQ